MKNTMRALVREGNRNLQIEQVPMPEIGETDVLLKSRVVGICGSDLLPYINGIGGFDRQVFGHEFVAEVVKVGCKVEDVSVGERVYGCNADACGKCWYCTHGQPQHCVESTRFYTGKGIQGALADYIRIKSPTKHEYFSHINGLVKIPDSVSDREAALAEPFGNGLYVVKQCEITEKDTVVVLGVGAVGNSVIQWCKVQGAKVVAVDVNCSRLQLAKKAGADYLIDIERLLPADYNPRKDLKPGDPEFEKLKRSVEEFGYVEPIIWNQRTGVVVGGHQRLKVLQYLGYTEVDCVVLDLDEQKEKALNIALNKISGAWDMPMLTALLKDLDESGFDATITGFDVSEMSALFDDQSEIVEDEPPAPAPQEQTPYTRRGDKWLLGKHVLVCGDSTNPEDMAVLMAGAKADLCITDPPYNVAYEGSNGLTIQNDNMPEEAFVTFLTSAFQQLHDNLKAGAPFYIWHAETEGGAFRRSCSEALGKVRQMLIWNKNSFTMGHQDYQWKHEACIYGWTEGASHYFVDDRTQATVIEDKRIDIGKLKKEEMRDLLKEIFSDKVSTTVLNEDKPARNDEHPTMKPLKLLARLVKNSSRQGEIVLDTFGGSGSTLITCQQLGRRCYTMELDPRYADVIVKRYLRFTGENSAVLIRNGKKKAVSELLNLSV